jgi:DNA adenine methylase
MLDTKELPNFLRYPGGKRRMLPFLSEHIRPSDEIHGCYIEPFVGGGAVFFWLQPKRALLSDVNHELIDLYKCIRINPQGVWKAFKGIPEGKETYNQMRKLRPSDLDPVMGAARLLYLNRTCFKGMWRHNGQGQFNVGYGGTARRWVITQDDLDSVSELLQSASIVCSDFEPIIDDSKAGDFIFVDPPYRPGMREQSNAHYVGQQFTFADQQRLAFSLLLASERGVSWTVTNSSHPDILGLYPDFRVIPMPRGTGRTPGALTWESGEAMIVNIRQT